MIVLVRHGETDANRAGLLLGRADPPLNDRGRQQAGALADALASIAQPLIVTSPLARALETATRIGASVGIMPRVDDRLIELDYGDWDGLRITDLPAGVRDRWQADPTFVPPGGESLGELRARVVPLATELYDQAEEHTTIAVSHVSPIKAVILWGLELGDEYSWRLRLDVASISRLSHGPTGPILVGFNDTSHRR
jgi:broad specificity phosphatase PhoE